MIQSLKQDKTSNRHDFRQLVTHECYNRATPAVYMLCLEITCRVQVFPAAAAFLLLYTRGIGQILFLLSHLNKLGEFYCGHNC